ncbi:MAG: PEP-CTERM sorting domain-containing protein [Planctomycetota bacterium]
MRRFGIIVTVAVLSSLLAASQSHADSTNWTGTTGDWHDPLNWDNGIPTSSDNAYNDNGGTAQITDITGAAESLYLYAGYNLLGTINQDGGTNTITRHLFLGYESVSSGTYNLSGTGELSIGYYDHSEYIGYYGTGEFNQTGGTNTVGSSLCIGVVDVPGSYGKYNLSGGELSARHEYVGGYSTGEFNQTGGINTVSMALRLGSESGSTGAYNLNAGDLLVEEEEVGRYGTGEFNQSGGTNTVNFILTLGFWAGSNGTYNLSGTGELSVSFKEYIGYEGIGEFNQEGGTHTVSSYLYLGRESGSSGIYNLSGGSLEVEDLEINYGWMDIDVSEIDLFAVSGDNVNLLDGYIDGDKIIDSTLGAGQYLYAFYDSENHWTTLDIGFIPEPGTIALIGAGLLGLAGLARKKCRSIEV